MDLVSALVYVLGRPLASKFAIWAAGKVSGPYKKSQAQQILRNFLMDVGQGDRTQHYLSKLDALGIPKSNWAYIVISKSTGEAIRTRPRRKSKKAIKRREKGFSPKKGAKVGSKRRRKERLHRKK